MSIKSHHTRVELQELLASIAVPLLYVPIHHNGRDYYTFRNIRTGEPIKEIVYPVVRYKISVDRQENLQIDYPDGSRDRLPRKRKLVIYDIDPFFKEKTKKDVFDMTLYRKLYRDIDSKINMISTKYDDNPEVLYEKIQKAVIARSCMNLKIDGKYYRGFKDVDTGKVIPEFLLPVVKYTIGCYSGEDFSSLDITIDDGITKRTCLIDDIDIMDIGNANYIQLEDPNASREIMTMEDVYEYYTDRDSTSNRDSNNTIIAPLDIFAYENHKYIQRKRRSRIEMEHKNLFYAFRAGIPETIIIKTFLFIVIYFLVTYINK